MTNSLIITLKLDEEGIDGKAVKANVLSKKLKNLYLFTDAIFRLHSDILKQYKIKQDELIPYVKDIKSGSVEVISEIVDLQIRLGEHRPFEMFFNDYSRINKIIQSNKFNEEKESSLVATCRYLREMINPKATNSKLLIGYGNRVEELNLDGITRQKISSILDRIKSTSHWVYGIIIGLRMKPIVRSQIGNDEGTLESEIPEKISLSFMTFDGTEGSVEISYTFYADNEEILRINSIIQIIGNFDQYEWKRTGVLSNVTDVLPISVDIMTYENVSKEYKEIIDQIKELDEGWDGPGSTSYEKPVIEKSLVFLSKLIYDAKEKRNISLPFPYMYPGSFGGIELEFPEKKYHIQVSILDEDTAVEIYCCSKKNPNNEYNETIIHYEIEDSFFNWLEEVTSNE